MYTEIALEMVPAFWKLESRAITLWGAQIHKRHTAYRTKTLSYTLMDHKILLRGLPFQFTLKTTAGTYDIYISVHIYLCVYMYIHVYFCIYIYIHTSIYIFFYNCTYTSDIHIYT